MVVGSVNVLVEVEPTEGVLHDKRVRHDLDGLLHQLLQHAVAISQLGDQCVLDAEFAQNVTLERLLLSLVVQDLLLQLLLFELLSGL